METEINDPYGTLLRTDCDPREYAKNREAWGERIARYNDSLYFGTGMDEQTVRSLRQFFLEERESFEILDQ